jgi:hypothetical protein
VAAAALVLVLVRVTVPVLVVPGWSSEMGGVVLVVLVMVVVVVVLGLGGGISEAARPLSTVVGGVVAGCSVLGMVGSVCFGLSSLWCELCGLHGACRGEWDGDDSNGQDRRGEDMLEGLMFGIDLCKRVVDAILVAALSHRLQLQRVHSGIRWDVVMSRRSSISSRSVRRSGFRVARSGGACRQRHPLSQLIGLAKNAVCMAVIHRL